MTGLLFYDEIYSTVHTVLYMQYCCNSTVATVLLQQYCWNSTVATVLLQQYCTVLYSTVQYCIYIYGALWGPRVPIYGALWGPRVPGLMDPGLRDPIGPHR